MERQRSTIVTPVHAARFAAGGGWVVTVQRLSAPPLTFSWKYLSASQGTVTTKHETWVDEKKKNTKFVCMYKNITRYKLWYITIAQRGLMAFLFHNEVQQKNGWRWTQLITFHKSCTQRYTQGIYTNQAQIILL